MCKHIGKPAPKFLVHKDAAATTHHFVTQGFLTCVVCINCKQQKDPMAVVSLLTHESVHIWQELCLFIGETAPGRELSAYGIQNIFQALLLEYKWRLE